MTAVYCPACGSLMGLSRSRHGEFFGCLRWPDCRETISALDREPYEPEVARWMAVVGRNENATEPAWVKRHRTHREQMIRRLESVRDKLSATEWDWIIGTVIICSGVGFGRAELGRQRHRVELIVSERRGR